MYIDLKVTRERFGGDDFTGPIISYQYSCELKFYAGPYVVKFYGQDNDVAEAAKEAIQGFLNGEIYGREVSGNLVFGSGRGYEAGIVFDSGIAPEVREIILTAIDLKTGGDRNKLTQEIYRES